MAAPENFALYYPDEPEAGTPLYSYVPTKCLMLGGTKDRPDLGLLQQQTADGEWTSYVVHPVRRRFVRPVWGASHSAKVARDTFFGNVRGLHLRYTDRLIYPTYYSVTPIGESVNGDWTPIGPGTDAKGAWARVEEFEESNVVSTLSDEGQVRAGYVEFAGSSTFETVTFDTPYSDDGYIPTISSCIGTDGGSYHADIVLPWRDDGFDVQLAAPPGTGVTVRVTYIAVHG